MLNVLRFVRRSTILESKPELLEKVVKKFHHNDKFIMLIITRCLSKIWV